MELVIRRASQASRGHVTCRSCLYQARTRALQESRRRTSIATPHLRSRLYTTTLRQNQNVNADTQVHPLGDFYADLLAKPIPKESKASTDLPTFVEAGGDITKEERAAKLFGSIKGSGYQRNVSTTPDETWQTVNGVPIPPRPSEPDNCCMSGCVHCVWDDYRDDIEDWATRLREAQAKAVGKSTRTTPKVQMPRPEVDVASTSMDDDGGGSEALWQSPTSSADPDDLFAGIPIGIREFMNVEKKIRERKRERETNAP